jgi:hypothetical protein
LSSFFAVPVPASESFPFHLNIGIFGNGFSYLLAIKGIGRHSVYGPVLPDALPG